MKNYMGCGGQIDESRLEEFEKSGLYVAEPKRDGDFVSCHSNGTMQFWSRPGKRFKTASGHVEDEFPKLPTGTTVTGELAFGQQDALERIEEIGHKFIDVYDITEIGGVNIADMDDNERRKMLEKAYKSWSPEVREYFRLNPRWTSDFRKHFDEEEEGLVLKQIKERPEHPYKVGSRSPYWIKCKKEYDVDVVIMDFVISEADSYKGQDMVKSLICGVYKEGELIQTTKVPGLTNKERLDISRNWKKYQGKVIQVTCNKVFKSGSLRHPRLTKFRDDKDPKECTWETLVPFMSLKAKESNHENSGTVRKGSKAPGKKQGRSQRNRPEQPVEKPTPGSTEGVRQTAGGVTKASEIAKLLDELGDLVALSKSDLPEDEQGSLPFKVRAYKKAVYVLGNSGSGFDFIAKDPTELEGIGEKIACKIREIVRTGTCSKLEELRQEYSEYLPLLTIPGVGPARARTLHDDHHATSVDDVRNLIESGTKLGKAIEEGIASMQQNTESKTESGRIPWAEAKKLSDPIVKALKKNKSVGRVERCGSYRRHKETVGDLDIVVETDDPDAVRTLSESLLDEVVLSGDKKVSGYVKGVQVDFRFTEPKSFGACLLYFTGSKQFNIRMRQKAKTYDYKLNEYALLNGKHRLAGTTEKEIFDVLGMAYVSPEKRI